MAQRYIIAVVRDEDGAAPHSSLDADVSGAVLEAHRGTAKPTHALLLLRRAPLAGNGERSGAGAWDVVALQDDVEGLEGRAQQLRANPQTVMLRNLERATVVLAASDGRRIKALNLAVTNEGGIPSVLYVVTVSEMEARCVLRALREVSRLDGAREWGEARLVDLTKGPFFRRGPPLSSAARSALLHLGVPLPNLR